MKPLVVDFNNLAKAMQEHLGWTSEELAAWLDIHVEEVIAWEKGMVTIPREMVFRIGYGMGFNNGCDHMGLSLIEELKAKNESLQ